MISAVTEKVEKSELSSAQKERAINAVNKAPEAATETAQAEKILEALAAALATLGQDEPNKEKLTKVLVASTIQLENDFLKSETTGSKSLPGSLVRQSFRILKTSGFSDAEILDGLQEALQANSENWRTELEEILKDQSETFDKIVLNSFLETLDQPEETQPEPSLFPSPEISDVLLTRNEETGALQCSGQWDPRSQEALGEDMTNWQQVFAWFRNGTEIDGFSESTLLRTSGLLTKGSEIACAVAPARTPEALATGPSPDQFTPGVETKSNTLIIPNSSPVGEVLCTGAAEVAFGALGEGFSLSCEGASDPDPGDTFAYTFRPESGSCPEISQSENRFTGSFETADVCRYVIVACDEEGACGQPSTERQLIGYSAGVELGTPSLDASCRLSIPGTATVSSNVQTLSFSGSSQMPGNPRYDSNGIQLTLDRLVHEPGNFLFSWILDQISLSSFENQPIGLNLSDTANVRLSVDSAKPPTLNFPAATPLEASMSGRQIRPAIPETPNTCVDRGSSGVYATISAGWSHVCALRPDGRIFCWGGNWNGQAGYETFDEVETPYPLPLLGEGQERAILLQAGPFHTCAVSESGAVYCWGWNDDFQLGAESDAITPQDTPRPTLVPGLESGVVSVALGESHTCALMETGDVKCLGANWVEQVGNGSEESNVFTPSLVQGLTSKAVAISAWGYFTCALTDEGAVLCWGRNEYGELGNGNAGRDFNSNIAVPVTGLQSGVKEISAGYAHACAVLESGSVKCWGDNYYGQFGNNSSVSSSVPVDTLNLTEVVSIRAGESYSCAILESGQAKCWGYNGQGGLGTGSTGSPILTPVDVTILPDSVIAITTGRGFTCALLSDGRPACWGRNQSSQLGARPANTFFELTEAGNLGSGITELAIGNSATCVLKTGSVSCLGANSSKQLGDTTTNPSESLVGVTGISANVTAIEAGMNHFCALDENQKIFCWGAGAEGQVGDGTGLASNDPVEISGTWKFLSLNGRTSCGIQTDDRAMCWGSGTSGQIGDGLQENRLSPTEVVSLSAQAVEIHPGGGHTCALLTTGKVECWGFGTSGQLGQGVSESSVTPVEVVGLSDVELLQVGLNHSCAYGASFGVRCWGINSDGQLGTGDFQSSNSPVSVSGLGSGVTIASLHVGYSNTCVTLEAGDILCWGANAAGELGPGHSRVENAPLSLDTGDMNVSEIVLGYFKSLCLKNDSVPNKIYCMGSNTSGRHGVPVETTDNYSANYPYNLNGFKLEEHHWTLQ